MSDTAPEITEPVAPAEPVEPVEPASPAAESAPAGTDTGSEAAESAVPATPAAESDPFEAFGGKEAVEAAHRLYEASRTEDGVIQLFIDAGRSLGLGLKDIQALFDKDSGGEEVEPPDPDEPLTRREFEEALARQQQTLAERQAAAEAAIARKAVQDTLGTLGLDPNDPTTKIVLQFGDQYTKGDLSPENVANAVRRGHADYLAAVERDAKKYLEKKVAAAEAVPSAPAGAAAPAEPPAAEPRDVAEAIKIARKRLAEARA